MTLELAGKRVLVLGLGVSGCSAANFCRAQGASVVAADERSEGSLNDMQELSGGIDLRLGMPFPNPAEFDLVVPSPGVPRERYEAGARKVWGDIELAWRALPIPVVAVTGTNGKSTTVKLIEAMLTAAGLRAQAAGNVGTPALALVGAGLDVAVLEVSSFQLETVDAFAPRVAVVLNLTPDHLDRHGDYASYVAAKARILSHQGPEDVAVLNFDDPGVRQLAGDAPGRVVAFSAGRSHDTSGASARALLDGNSVVLSDEQSSVRISLEGLRLAGRHNLENCVAALAAVWAMGADPRRGAAALGEFCALPHRSEVVARRENDGVLFVNDSKATNVGAALRSLEGFDEALLWIAGGSDKGLSFDELAAAAKGRVRRAFLIGETAERLAEALSGHVPYERAGSLEEAVRRAAASARPQEIVLLCPACASFDQFTSFEERGERFAALVRSVLNEEGEA